MSRRAQTVVLVVAVALAAPIALVFETALRSLLFPIIAPDFELARTLLEPVMTPVAWLLVLVSAIAGVLGVALQRTLAQRRIARLGAAALPAQVEAARNQVFFLTTTIPQIPTIASTFAFMFGASPVPTLVGVSMCTVSVLVQGVVLATSSRGG